MGYRIAAAYAALLVLGSPLVLTTAGCSTATIEELKPRDARAAYAEAEILFTGVIVTTETLATRGFISGETVKDLLTSYVEVAESLDDAWRLLKAGESVAALAKIDFAHDNLKGISAALSRAAEAFLPPPESQPVPSASRPPVI